MPRRVLTGRVTSDKMDKTITVLVDRRVMHPLYKKFIRKSKKYAAHDADNVCKIGDIMQVKVIAIDDQDRVKLSRKALLREQNKGAGGGEVPGGGGPPRREGGERGAEYLSSNLLAA